MASGDDGPGAMWLRNGIQGYEIHAQGNLRGKDAPAISLILTRPPRLRYPRPVSSPSFSRTVQCV